jgi:hypothetical protein
MTATFQTPDQMIGPVNLTETRRFLETGRELAASGLGPAHVLLDDSRARRIAMELETRFAEAEALFNDALAQREKLGRDVETRPDLLRQRRQALQADYAERSAAIQKRVAQLSDELRPALLSEALPAPSSDSAALLARQELQLALDAAPDGELGMQTLVGLVQSRGGDLAAVAASNWGRLALQAKTGDEIGYQYVLDTAAKTSLESPDPARQRAAQTLAGLNDNQGRDQVAVGAVYLNSVLESGARILETPVAP